MDILLRACVYAKVRAPSTWALITYNDSCYESFVYAARTIQLPIRLRVSMNERKAAR
jgi:hypothetical protein